MKPSIDKSKYTPMMRQYLEIKEKYQDALVFFRLGDFYEMFFNDAITASRELEIVLTGRDAGDIERVPMCGVPHHSVHTYIDRLTEKGYKVAIVEQLEDPSVAKGIVMRDVTRIITPGTVMEGSNIEEKSFNYIASIERSPSNFSIAYLDISTGESFVTTMPYDEELLRYEILKLNAKEVIISSKFNKNILEILRVNVNLVISINENTNTDTYMDHLFVGLSELEFTSSKRLINYIMKTQKRTLIHLQSFTKYGIKDFLNIDLQSRRNLELTESIRGNSSKHTLFHVLDYCQTAMGSRYLKKNIHYPLVNHQMLQARYNMVEAFNKNFIIAEEIRKSLSEVYDLERIVGRISYENANPKDLLQLKRSLHILPSIKNSLKSLRAKEAMHYSETIQEFKELHQLIDESIKEEAPYTIKDGNMIKSGFNAELDEIISISSNNKDFLLSLEQKERERSGIKNLRVGYNKVFGYYIEVSKGNIPLVKDELGYIRKQTLSNAERYITQELKEREIIILRADEQRIELEYQLFVTIRNTIKKNIAKLQELASIISQIDMLSAFSKAAKDNNYNRPTITHYEELEIIEGRHPVMEKFIKEPIIPNDILMFNDQRILLITGPNMSGKSTYMRQTALIAIMAQIGSFVPAKKAKLPIFDQIFTRIGASDDIVSGQSTFMVEMMEVNYALQNATEQSLILLDEIGRGTATFDGMALAQAIIEYIHDETKCKALFSTHYHELTVLDQSLPQLKNVHVEAALDEGKIVFLHKVMDGPTDESYGINVASLAELPINIIYRAKDILSKLEKNANYETNLLSKKNYQAPTYVEIMTPEEKRTLKMIKHADLENMKPLDALIYLASLKESLKQ